jgi:hypothetical protein
VAVVVLENHAPADVLRSGWLARAARHGGQATSAFGETHPSLGNYLALLSGSTLGVSDDDVSRGPFAAPTVVGQFTRRHVSWRAYLNGMPTPCFGRTDDQDVTGRYAKRHNPFLLFTEVTAHPGLCAKHVVPGGRLRPDLTRGLPRFVWITPDLCQDMHDCPVSTGERWMAHTLPALIRALGPHGVLFVTADEGTDDEHGGGRIPLVALGRGVRPGSVLRRVVDHRALLATVQDILGLGRLPTTRGAATLGALLRG